MKEARVPSPVVDPHVETFRAALATVLELPVETLPELPPGEEPATGWAVSRWLGGLGLGLVPVADARSFAWAGPWIARLRPPDGHPRFVVMYGVPSGLVWDPGGPAAFEPD